MTIKEILQFALERHQTGNFKQAEQSYKKVLKKQPNNFDALHMLGVLCSQIGHHNAAIQYIEKALKFNTNSYFANFNLGKVFSDLKKYDKAIEYYQKAVQLKTDYSDAYYSLGNAYENIGQLQKAIDSYQNVLVIDPYNVYANYNIGSILLNRGHLDKAILYFRKAVQLNTNFDEAYNNLGCALQQKGQFDEAVDNYKKAININPKYDEAYCNLGIIFACENQLDKAISYYQKALQINPDSADAHWNLSLALLISGNLNKGWNEYKWRWKSKDFLKYSCFHRPVNFTQPILNGLAIAGHTILIYAEQGLGDEIQFIRYAPLIAHHGATVIMECHRELHSLLHSIKGIKQFIVQGEPLPDFDMQCPLLNLPLVFNTMLHNIPSEVPYVAVNSILIQKWKDKIKKDDSILKVGLVWSGNPKNTKLKYKSFPIETFMPLIELEEVTFYSLQKGEASEQAKNLRLGPKFVDLTEEINDFSDTAALIENLDLTISVDTSVAHLAGALGKPIWTLIPFSPDWRWMLNREDSPWYPTMRLFRQPSRGDWASVITKIKEELHKLLSK